MLAVAAVAVAAAGCLPDNQGAVGPTDPARNTIFQDINAQRRANGLPDLGYSPKLDFDASIWAAIMGQRQSLQHQDLNALLAKPDHSAFWTLGENILVGPWYMNWHDVVTLFMGSPVHRDNILNRNYTVVGVGTSYNHGGLWVSVVFGGL